MNRQIKIRMLCIALAVIVFGAYGCYKPEKNKTTGKDANLVPGVTQNTPAGQGAPATQKPYVEGEMLDALSEPIPTNGAYGTEIQGNGGLPASEAGSGIAQNPAQSVSANTNTSEKNQKSGNTGAAENKPAAPAQNAGGETQSGGTKVVPDSAAVMFIGNEMIFQSDIPEKFRKLAESQGKNVKTLDRTVPGYRLTQHLSDLSSGAYQSMINETGVVILQEDIVSNIGTRWAVEGIMGLFPSGCKFYYLVTEQDLPGKYSEVQGIQGLGYIRSGDVHNALLRRGFSREQLHVADGYEPSNLYAYATACSIYSTLYGKSCVGLPYNMFMSSNIPGGTAEKKAQAIRTIQETVMEMVG